MVAIGKNLVKWNMEKRKRNISIEGLRIVFMLFIVVLHGYYHGINNLSEIYAWGKEPSMSIHLVMFTLCNLGVTGFMFISGY
jgi:peptidoglycan/LPS O-acetylase OafA/YrhL